MENVSVIVPTWNRAHLLKRVIQGAFNQSVTPLEILVSDDGSVDDSEKIVKSINNNRVKWINGMHAGLPAVVRDKGIKIAKGEWITFLDSDDWWKKDKLKKQLELVKKLQVKAACSSAYVVIPCGSKKEELCWYNWEIPHLKDNFYFISSESKI